MYKFLILIISVISLQSCAQNTKSMNKEVNDILGNLYKEVKHRDKAISYRAIYFIGGCNFELLINDFPIMTYYGEGDGSLSESAPINTAILKKGEQTWKIRVYPVHDKKEIDGKVVSITRPAIQDGARVELAIEGIKFKENGDIEKRFGKLFEFEAPLKKDEETGKNVFADAGKPYVEYSGTFYADVPYEVEGWQKSVDLSKEDPKLLQAELLKEYEKYKKWIQNRELDKIAESNLKSEKEFANVNFFNANLNKEYVDNFIDTWGRENSRTQPLENYSLKYYGNGKIIELINNSYKKSTLWVSFKDKQGIDKYTLYTLYFHRPKAGGPLEVIR